MIRTIQSRIFAGGLFCFICFCSACKAPPLHSIPLTFEIESPCLSKYAITKTKTEIFAEGMSYRHCTAYLFNKPAEVRKYLHSNNALQLTCSIIAVKAAAEYTPQSFAIAFLNAGDYEKDNTLKMPFMAQNTIKGTAYSADRFTVSMAFPECAKYGKRSLQYRNTDDMASEANIHNSNHSENNMICGIVICSDRPLTIHSAAVTKARFGWIKGSTISAFFAKQAYASHTTIPQEPSSHNPAAAPEYPDAAPLFWCGFTAQGGSVPAELWKLHAVPARTQFAVPLRQMHDTRTIIRIFTQHGTYKNRNIGNIHTRHAQNEIAQDNRHTIECQIGNYTINLASSPAQSEYTLDTRLFNSTENTVTITKNQQQICGIITETIDQPQNTPIITDTELILHWKEHNWRQAEYELFAWELFPSVLIFDFKNYRIQNRFFKRLAFYAEKAGFAGTILTNQAMQHNHHIHGFNAYDFSAKTLAAFFDLAATQHIILTKEEYTLQTILLANNIIIKTVEGIIPGKGAVVSISQESNTRLRKILITHENLHGIYFTQPAFRDIVDTVLAQTDPISLQFLRRYFEVTLSLNYNTDDTTLLKNEYMAYMLQQNLTSTPQYFANILAYQKLLRKYEPALCRHVQKTKGEAFYRAAARMSAFLYEKWGIQAGNTGLVSLKKQ